MTDKCSDYLELCALSNKTFDRYCHIQSASLERFTEMQADIVIKNRRIRPAKSPDDFYRLTYLYVKERLGEDAAADIRSAMETGVINTADHHGGLFCAQTFQGDLLFAELLRKLGFTGNCFPLHSGGQVELGNATYGRGLISYTSRSARSYYPLFPAKDRQRLTSHAKAVDRQLLDAFYKRVSADAEDKALAGNICGIIRNMYDDPEVLSCSRFGDQVAAAGKRLCDSIFEGDDHPVLTYIELEEIVRPLITADLHDEDSLLCRLISDRQLRHALSDVKTDAGVPISGLLFRNADSRGRKSLLTLTRDGLLTGKDWHGGSICYKADPDSVSELLESRQIFPGLFTIALLIAMERGVTWTGGVFQSVYLPDWQDKLVRVLAASGMRREAEQFASFDCSSYICGPMYALFEGDGFASTAGPFEFFLRRPEWSRVKEMMHDTDIRDSHRIGLSEMYSDLVAPRQRDENWYGTITSELYSRFPADRI